jgi:uncharacterized protein YdeI (YjbR/CyaY-like superfamily)
MVTRNVRPVPQDLYRALADAGLVEEYSARPRQRRHDDLAWIRQARQPGVRKQRIDDLVDVLATG